MIIRDAADVKYFDMGRAGTFKVICDGDSGTLGLGHMMPGDEQAAHRHPNEQMGYVLEGECELYVEGEKHVVRTGDTYHISPNCEHSWHAIGKECFSYVDFFTPKRMDLVNGKFDPSALKDLRGVREAEAAPGCPEVPDRVIPVVRDSTQIDYFTQGNGGIVKVIVDAQYATMSKGTMVLGEDLPSHHHPNEQMGYVLSGAAELIVDDEPYIVKAGCAYHLPCDSWHTWRAIGNERFTYLDFFVPRRLDLVNGQFNFAKWTSRSLPPDSV